MAEPVRILIADDHPLFREGVAASLAVAPDFAVVAQVGSGEEAVTYALALQPDMVLLDVNMPGIGGIAAARQIVDRLARRAHHDADGRRGAESLLAALKAGAHGYVLKGVAAHELRDIIRNVAAGDASRHADARGRDAHRVLAPAAAGRFRRTHHARTEVLELLSRALTNREIGERLHLAEKTVKHHMTVILQKAARSHAHRSGAARRAARRPRTCRPALLTQGTVPRTTQVAGLPGSHVEPAGLLPGRGHGRREHGEAAPASPGASGVSEAV
jgi:DNA-binding NarL/FixJ family response regulator